MATVSAQQATPAHNLSASARAEAAGVQTQSTAAPEYPIPRGNVEAELHFYSPPSDGSAPYNWVDQQPEGTPQHNYGATAHNVTIHDIRGSESSYTLDKDAFAVLQNVPSLGETEFVDDDHIKAHYYPEVEKVLLDNVPGANKIFIFDHTIRRPGPNAKRGPVNRAHIDQIASSAKERVKVHLPDEAEKLWQGRYRIINVWRPLNGPLVAQPLSFASSHTVRDEDLIPVEHRYPNRVGYTASVAYNEGQRWNYLSGMRNDERILLECFDSEGLKEGSEVKGGRVPHSAFVDPRTPEGAPGRESIEVRALVFGP
ncbi:hypothetical protein V500_08280 [Pseudogymnoascus sp. VKM F-4518 (FW-2643)]|nr:hypothetical protein V500_08280 [Pseudogymnoascus sp. VKM F-4518 (FW-2643)]